MTQYVIFSTDRETMKEKLEAARRTFKKGTWENLIYGTSCSPLWIMTTKEAAIIECRRYNKQGVRSQTYFALELETYDK